ncbi:MAG: pilin [Candidatus Paceibacterota bacterium]
MRNILFAIAFSFVLIGSVFLITPDVSYAQSGLVPCGNGVECTVCHVGILAENVINFIVNVSFIVAAILFAYAGFLLFTAGADPSQVTKARKMFTDTLIGIVIILTSWLVVNVLLTALTGKGVNPFTSLVCEQREHVNEFRGIDSSTSSGLGVTGSTKETAAVPETNCTDCALLSSSILTNGNACKSAKQVCFVDKELGDSLLKLQERAASSQYNLSNESWQVTEAWPPTVEHKAVCHYEGTCVDISFTQKTPRSPKNVQSFIEAASSAQLRAVYEVQTEARKNELSSQGVTSVIVVPTINGEHFSVYKIESLQSDTEVSKEHAGEFSQ